VLILFGVLMSGCAASQEIPSWFDSFERLPVHTVLVDNHRIAYLDEGQGPPVVLIHGFAGSIWQWEYQQRALSTQFRVITLDLLGAGLSDKPDIEYRPDQFVSFFVGFLDALKVEHASLVGNSMGAGLAIAMAVAHPKRVDRLVLISGFPPQVKKHLTSPIIKSALDRDVPLWLVELGNWLVGARTSEAVLREIVFDHSKLTPAVLDRSNRNRRRPGLLGPILAMGRSLQQWEDGYARRLGEITHPTLILWGEQDRVFPIATGEKLHATISGSRFERIQQAGHIPQWEAPDQVNPLLTKFLVH
jgi:pimeloyl-ACP methyl ester carboxylesterase